ncbi:MAG: hypothetical protein J7530_06410 [Novosphingobium sp.]|nr:hypothetical protein [Novosphingobium sp.]
MGKHANLIEAPTGVSPPVLVLRDELIQGAMRQIARFALADRSVEVLEGRDALWAVVRRAGKGGLAIRAAHLPGGATKVRKIRAETTETCRIEVEGPTGAQTVLFDVADKELATLHITTTLTPAAPLLIPVLPRDLYPLGENDDPFRAVGRVEAAQRGLNTGLSYFHLDEPAFGSVLYVQNFTALAAYFEATDTTPDGAVGGEWPELGYLPPTPQSGTPPTCPLSEGTETTISDALIVFHDDVAADGQDLGRRFIQMLGAAYRRLELPDTEFRDWVARADRTLRDLERADEASIRHYGNRYARPYTDAEYPDIMVQMSLIAALRDFAVWRKEPIPLEEEFMAGMGKFRDAKLKTLRRYLPNVGSDKDKNAVDSWYLYHPMLNLGRLALRGEARAKRMFLGGLGYAIKAAHRFKYAWPIQFKIDDFSVIVEARNNDGLGQTDVGGLYAYVMLQAYELTKKQQYLQEARAAIDAAKAMRFELNYQANLTAWGAAACMRLWRITAEEYYLRHSYVYLASFFHNSAIWESQIKAARHYSNFLGVTCLHDGPYMAIYECFDSFAAFERYLKDSGPDLDPAARMLISEYCRYALHRAWFYYPDALPSDCLATEIRNGHIDKSLSFPLEDLYHDGQPPGQVGQEIYGAGAAFVFATRAFHAVEGETFEIYCDHFLMSSERNHPQSVSVRLEGGEGCQARLSLVRRGRSPLPDFIVEVTGGDRIRASQKSGGRIDFIVPASSYITIRWVHAKDKA